MKNILLPRNLRQFFKFCKEWCGAVWYLVASDSDQVSVACCFLFVLLHPFRFPDQSYLHRDCGIVHRDLKPENVLVDPLGTFGCHVLLIPKAEEKSKYIW